MHTVRMGLSLVCAFAVTIGLFLFMSYLISGGHDIGDRGDQLGSIRFGPVKVDDQMQVKERRVPKKPPPPKEPPPPPKMNVQNVQRTVSPMPALNMPKLDVPVSGSGPFLGAFAAGDQNAEGDIIPLVRIQPMYPRRAAIAKIEGYVTIEFTITETGSVTDPTVIDAKPPRVFDREAIRAILKWKFKPRIIDGQPVARRATQTLDFKLADT
ncbi:MAG: energy transducer TonB [Xanthomonadales bacterium]|nr:energy transducer TonB [Xanthomonadales bacterium]